MGREQGWADPFPTLAAGAGREASELRDLAELRGLRESGDGTFVHLVRVHHTDDTLLLFRKQL